MTSFCRICFAANVKMYDLQKSYLKGFYEKLINYDMNEDIINICYICYSVLKKSHNFMLQAIQSNDLLNQLTYKNIEIQNKRLKHNNIFNLNNVILDNVIIINETESLKEERDVKEEYEIELDDTTSIDFKLTDTADVKPSDSEDDVPLSTLNLNNKNNDKTKSKKKRIKFADIKVDAREIILTEEEQVSDMQARARSLNYLNSPYKCNLCYRGFIDPVAYGKHRDKHDEKNGAHKCAICHLRYASGRLMRAHVISTHSRRYECNVCKQLTHTRHQAKEHEQWHNGHTFLCKLCGQIFRKSSSYLTHLRKSHASKHICVSCGASFVSAYGLRVHVAKAHRGDVDTKKDEPISDSFCTECKIQFKTVDAWKRHVIAAHYVFEGKGATCPICKEHVSEAHRFSHMRTHTMRVHAHEFERTPAMTTLSCDHCESKFFNLTKLRTHIKRVHLGYKYDKNIVCETCGKHCTSTAALQYHQRRHSGERPYACPQCSMRFRCREHARIHYRTHSGERPCSCPVCGKAFTQKPALNRHYAIHTGSKPFECQYCAKTFSQSSSLKAHIKTVHLKIPRKASQVVENKIC
ncbi:zinc finger protein 2 homolog [Colias croceus]|uniref:zinc finger protein 2 homolog n=1 Tax=Colias crocea TaxID=72248 RepID=UPI001E27AC30|nr:zinc finger protein 2 homolog [Colias croceus]